MPTVTRRELRSLIGKWHRILGIPRQWRIVVNVVEKPRNTDEETEDAHARIAVSPQYFTADLDVYAWNCADVDLDEVICHEMLHIVLKPTETVLRAAYGKRLAETAEQHCESINDFLCRAFVRLASERRKRA